MGKNKKLREAVNMEILSAIALYYEKYGFSETMKEIKSTREPKKEVTADGNFADLKKRN